MITDVTAWEAFERELERATPVDVARNFRILDAMYEHARALGTFPSEDPCDGLEDTLKLVNALHASANSEAIRRECDV